MSLFRVFGTRLVEKMVHGDDDCFVDCAGGDTDAAGGRDPTILIVVVDTDTNTIEEVYSNGGQVVGSDFSDGRLIVMRHVEDSI